MPNYVLNSSFEKYSNGLSPGAVILPDSWLALDGGVNVVPDIDYGPNYGTHGSVTLNIVRNAGHAVGYSTGIYQDNVALPAAVGASIVLSGFLFPEYIPRDSLRLHIVYHDAAHAVVGESYADFAVGAFTYNGVLQRKFVTGVIPAGTHHIQVRLETIVTVDDTVGPTLAYYHADKIQLEAGTTPTDYKPSYRDLLDIYTNGQYMFKDLVMNAHSPVYHYANTNELYAEYGNGAEVIVTKADGMYDLPDIKPSGEFEADFMHGGMVTGPDFLGMRHVTIDLSVVANEEYILHRLLAAIRTTLMESINSPTYQKFFWKRDHYGTRGGNLFGMSKKFSYARVRRFSGFTSTYEMAVGRMASGSIEFVFPDPAWYDYLERNYTFTIPAGNLSWTSGDGEGNFGRGTFRSFPRIRVYGPVTNPAIFAIPINPTSEPTYTRGIRLAAAIPGGQWVEFNTRDRTVIHSSGADWSQYLSPSNQWWYLPSMWQEGGNNLKFIRWVFQSTVNGAGYTATVYDNTAWI